MSYFITKTTDFSFEEVLEKIPVELKKEGFGILTEIDVKETFKKKIDVDFRKYKILGACNPAFAYKALTFEDKLGVMLPCNIIVQEREDGKIEVSAINPMVSMETVKNPELQPIAGQVSDALKRVIEHI